jgi:hypothetical protein
MYMYIYLVLLKTLLFMIYEILHHRYQLKISFANHVALAFAILSKDGCATEFIDSWSMVSLNFRVLCPQNLKHRQTSSTSGIDLHRTTGRTKLTPHSINH